MDAPLSHELPAHLQKYIVEQHYEKYTPIDQASWRYILRQLRNFLSKHAHESYLEGLEKTGIEIEKIPRIEDISKKLQKFGWRALPVSGFIPPAAFMELQSLGVLPIASDMRTLEHLSYTPAPDIVHEAAGHAPILIQPEFAAYLKEYAQVAKKAILSKEDLNQYDAIRELSDLKENPSSTTEQIEAAQKRLEETSTSISHISEAAELARMNWWTAEYGLIGTLDNAKIYGAGLLSSVGESKWCLSDEVRKIPLTAECIRQPYDITEPQPQLFVTPNFKTLSLVLEEMSSRMAFRKGGLIGIQKAIRAETINTAELDSGLQISGQFVEALNSPEDGLIYIRTQGPTQLSFQNKVLDGHETSHHSEGFGAPVGPLTAKSKGLVSKISTFKIGEKVQLEYKSGVSVQGAFKSALFSNSKLLVLTLTDCTVSLVERILFQPEWGLFDLIFGETVTSVFGGAADREAFGSTDDFIAKRVSLPSLSPAQKELHGVYAEIRSLREKLGSSQALNETQSKQLEKLWDQLESRFPKDWLARLEIFEILMASAGSKNFLKVVTKRLEDLKSDPSLQTLLEDGIRLAQH